MTCENLIRLLSDLKRDNGNMVIHVMNDHGDIQPVKSIQDIFTIRGEREFTRHTLSAEEQE